MEDRQKRHKTFYVNSITPIDFCGTTYWEMNLNGAFELPFKIEPTEGEHDFNKCEGCQKSLAHITKWLRVKFDGDKNKQGFPFCCSMHANLVKIPEFKREAFINVPEMVARKVIYTYQHIANNYNKENWYKVITDYIDWSVDSFGQMPKDCGERLFLSNYITHVIDKLNNIEDCPKQKKNKIISYLNSIQSYSPESNTDLKTLLDTYQAWINIFPFELESYFGELKNHFEKQIPILNGEPEVNIYSGIAKVKMHTKASLVITLINLTNSLLTHINALSLYEKGKITNADKIRLELLISSRRSILKQGYLSNLTAEEHKYRKILTRWFNDEKKFIQELTPLLAPPIPPEKETKTDKLRAELSKHGFFDLPLVKVLALEKREALIKLLGSNGLPYNIAMFEYLGYLKYLKEYFSSNVKLNKGISKWFNSDKDGRSVKGNISSLSDKTNEDKKKYTAHTHKEKVKHDYNFLK